MKKILLIGLLWIAWMPVLFSQEDVEGCKDYPMFNRMPNTYITECLQNYNELEFQTGDETWLKKEGTLTHINYGYDYDKPGTPPSFFQIIKNYENAIAKFGGKKVYYSGQGNATLFTKSKGKDVWIVLEDFGGVGEGQYAINILEIEGMKQEITANEMLNALNKDGFIALYLPFDTGKYNLKPESQAIMDEIETMLKMDANIKISIEGHTDNVGSPASNQTLSENRAKAVKDALVAKGIAADRLKSQGWGQDKPIADNRTEDGRAKNRRVEIVKL